MVYCSKCGTLNPDTAVNCSNCGSPLYAGDSRPYSRYERRRYYQENYGHYHREGNGVGLLIAGIFIILIGLVALYGFSAFWNYFWPIALILLGFWILVLGLRHNRRYNQAPPA